MGNEPIVAQLWKHEVPLSVREEEYEPENLTDGPLQRTVPTRTLIVLADGPDGHVGTRTFALTPPF
jgi:hypothetical protein